VSRSRLRSLLRSLTRHLSEGAFWWGMGHTGLMWTPPPPDARRNRPDDPSDPPLTDRERAAWADLVRRLR